MRDEIGKIRFPFLLDALAQMSWDNLVHDAIHPFLRWMGAFNGNELAIDAENHRGPDFQMNIRGPALNGGLQNPMKHFHEAAK
jgi:hypothetical protein